MPKPTAAALNADPAPAERSPAPAAAPDEAPPPPAPSAHTGDEARVLNAVHAAGWLSAAAVRALNEAPPSDRAPAEHRTEAHAAADRLLLAAEALVAHGALRRALRSGDGAPLPGPCHLSALLTKQARGEALSPDEAAIEVGYEAAEPPR